MQRRPSLQLIDAGCCQPASRGIGVYDLGPEVMASLCEYMQEGRHLGLILRVSVQSADRPADDNAPAIFGRYQVLEDSVQFLPHFPFERGLSYLASFDPRPLNCSESPGLLTFEFSLPKVESTFPPEVKFVLPSSDYLPENLLRFYVYFSNAMQRGRVEGEIRLFGPGGDPAPDALYRAPMELWDTSMQYLTILFDPGRLKRGVGPNRELGAPLKVGEEYTLVIGSRILDFSGRPLRENYYKRFRVIEAVRKKVAVDQWTIATPATETRQPLVLTFPRPLDWALLSQMITVVSTGAQLIEGHIEIDQCETRWSFTPTLPWVAGSYQVRVDSNLEDVCGNNVKSEFDGPLQSARELANGVADRSMYFELV